MRTLTLCLALIAAVGCDRNSKKSDSKPSGGACTGQPYSPVQAGACTPFDGQPRFAFVDPAGLLGNYCAPACQGFAQTCPDVAGTSAEGKCFFVKDGTQYCAAWCRIDAPAGSAQCPCGATCQPHGPPDDDGNLRGVCLFKQARLNELPDAQRRALGLPRVWISSFLLALADALRSRLPDP